MLLSRGKRKLRDVPVGHDVQRVRAADQVDGPEAGQLQCRQSDGVAAGAARQGLDVRHRATGEVHRRAIGKDDGVAVGAAIDRLARGEVAVGQVDRVVAATRRDRVGALAACDGIGVGAAGDREGFGLTRQRDRDASPGRRRGDRLHPLDR